MPEPRRGLTRHLSSWRFVIFLLAAVALYVYSWSVTGIDFPRLVTDAPKIQGIAGQLLRPDVILRGEVSEITEVELPAPCPEGPAPDPIEPGATGPRIFLDVGCAAPDEIITIFGAGWEPDVEVRLRWLLPTDTRLRIRERPIPSEEGEFRLEAQVTPLMVPEEEEQPFGRIQAEQIFETDEVRPSPALLTTIEKMIETIFMALMATTMATIVAAPLSFLGARNLMTRSRLGTVVYYITRTIFNTLRSIEPLVLATVFIIWVSFGPFPGVLALTVHTIASLGKLFSEAVENISEGPMEAVTATGANRLQVLLYSVLPQVIPPYIAFIIYHWDINVRMSTIIGFVGGGGIGMQLKEWTDLLAWSKAGTAVWAIVVVVTAMDYLSAKVRERMV